MGRSKAFTPLSKAERKRVKNGVPVDDNINQTGYATLSEPRNLGIAYTRDRASPRGPRHSQTSNNWVHAILFVVLVVIVVSWALGY